MVDWVVEAARPLGADPLVVVASPATADAFDGRRRRRPGASRSAPGTPSAPPARPSGTRTRCSCFPATRRSSPPSFSPVCSTRTESADAAATVLSFVPDDMRSYGRVLRDDDGDLVAIVEAADATPEQLEIARGQLLDLRLPGRRALARARAADAANAQGELYLTDAVRGIVESGQRVAVHVAPDPDETEGVNTRVELARAGGALRDRINRAHMLAGVTIVDPRVDLDRPDGDAGAGRRRPSVHGAPRRDTVATGAEIGPHAVVVDATIGPRCARRARSVTFAPAPCSGHPRKAGTFVELKNTRRR